MVDLKYVKLDIPNSETQVTHATNKQLPRDLVIIFIIIVVIVLIVLIAITLYIQNN